MAPFFLRVNLSGATIFSKIDLVKAPGDIPKRAIVTPFGMFEYLRMTFEFRNAVQTFQRFVNNVTRGLPFVYAYYDDFLLASPSPKDHHQHLRKLFSRLHDFGLVLNQHTKTYLRSVKY